MNKMDPGVGSHEVAEDGRDGHRVLTVPDVYLPVPESCLGPSPVSDRGVGSSGGDQEGHLKESTEQ